MIQRTFRHLAMIGFVPILITAIFSQEIIDPFSQPNDSTLAWYGSGDVNMDNILNWDDYNKMVAEAPQIDEADLNGNEIPSDTTDQRILLEYLNGTRGHLPGQWNMLQTREKRIGWVDKMLAIDQTDTITYYYPYWISGNYGGQTSLNFAGFEFKNQQEKVFVATKYDTTSLGRFNIPVYHVAFSAPGIGHGMNAVLVGDNPLIPQEWVYPDQQERGPINDLRILGESWNPSPNSAIGIAILKEVFQNSSGNPSFRITSLITFKTDSNNTFSIYYQSDYLLLTRPTVAVINNSKLQKGFWLNQNHPNPFNPFTTISYSLDKDSDVSVHIYDISGKLITTLQKEYQIQGTHSIIWNGTDDFGSKIGAGIYFYQLKAGDFVQTKKMVLMK